MTKEIDLIGLADSVIANYPRILARLGDGGTGCIEGWGGLSVATETI